MKLNDFDVKLLLDSGSSVNILDEMTYRKIGKPKLRKGKAVLTPYGGNGTIKVIGTCDLTLFRNQPVVFHDYVPGRQW